LTPPPTVLHWPGGGTWAPSNLANLAVWYKADSLSQANNSTVSLWPDSSGASRNLTGYQSVTFKHNQIGGLPAVELTGGFLQRSTWTGFPATNDAVTAAGVVTFTSTQMFLSASDSGTARLDILRTETSTLRQLRRQGSNYRYCDGPTNLATGARVLVTAKSAAGVASHRVDGSEQSVQYFLGSNLNVPTNATPAQMTIGGLANGSGTATDRLANGSQVGELCLIDSDLPQADKERLEGYLAHKWGLTANLPSSHPYKSSAP